MKAKTIRSVQTEIIRLLHIYLYYSFAPPEKETVRMFIRCEIDALDALEAKSIKALEAKHEADKQRAVRLGIAYNPPKVKPAKPTPTALLMTYVKKYLATPEDSELTDVAARLKSCYVELLKVRDNSRAVRESRKAEKVSAEMRRLLGRA